MFPGDDLFWDYSCKMFLGYYAQGTREKKRDWNIQVTPHACDVDCVRVTFRWPLYNSC